jgi:hypothetical protein
VLSVLAFIIFRSTRRRRAWEREQEVIDPEPAVPRTRVEKIPSPSPGPPSDSKDTQPTSDGSVLVTETPAGGSSTPGPSTSQMAMVPSQHIARRPLPVPNILVPSTPAPSIQTSIPPSALNLPLPPAPAPAPSPPSNLDSTPEMARLTPEEARFVHTLYSQNVPHGEIVDILGAMRAERGTGTNPTEQAPGDAPPAYNVVT